MVDGNDPYIFISHASAEADAADFLCNQLEKAGYRCWIAPRNISAGEHYAFSLSRALANASAILVMLDENANKSTHVVREITSATEQSKLIFVLHFGSFSLNDTLSYLLSGIQKICAPPIKEQQGFDEAIARQIYILNSAFTHLKAANSHQNSKSEAGRIIDEVPPDQWDFASNWRIPKLLMNLFSEK
jgi:hypothetical protein